MATVFEKIRLNSNKSQQEVAVYMGLSITAYRNKEKGRSRFFVDELSKFSEIVGVGVDEVTRLFFLDQSCHKTDTINSK